MISFSLQQFLYWVCRILYPFNFLLSFWPLPPSLMSSNSLMLGYPWPQFLDLFSVFTYSTFSSSSQLYHLYADGSHIYSSSPCISSELDLHVQLPDISIECLLDISYLTGSKLSPAILPQPLLTQLLVCLYQAVTTGFF